MESGEVDARTHLAPRRVPSAPGDPVPAGRLSSLCQSRDSMPRNVVDVELHGQVALEVEAETGLARDGQAITLELSIGNWSFPCRSHYWIRKDKVVWGRQFSQEEMKIVREQDRDDLEDFVDAKARHRPPKKLRSMDWLWRR